MGGWWAGNHRGLWVALAELLERVSLRCRSACRFDEHDPATPCGPAGHEPPTESAETPQLQRQRASDLLRTFMAASLDGAEEGRGAFRSAAA